MNRSSLPQRTKPIRRQSNKNAQRERNLRRMKLVRIEGQIDFQGHANCEYCPAKFFTVESARAGLEFHHKVFRSQGGTDEDANLALVCRSCHDVAHGIVSDAIERAEYEEWADMALDAGGFDDGGGEEEGN